MKAKTTYKLNIRRELSFQIYLTLFLIFTALKLVEVEFFVNLSWWWITAPLWAPLILTITGIVFFSIMALLVLLYKDSKK